MPIKKETCLYEVLIRFGPEGYRGAHVQDLERVVEVERGKETKVHAETPSQARPVTLEEVGELIGAESAKLIEAVEKERARADAAEVQVEQLAQTLEAETAARTEFGQKLARVAAAIGAPNDG